MSHAKDGAGGATGRSRKAEAAGSQGSSRRTNGRKGKGSQETSPGNTREDKGSKKSKPRTAAASAPAREGRTSPPRAAGKRSGKSRPRSAQGAPEQRTAAAGARRERRGLPEARLRADQPASPAPEVALEPALTEEERIESAKYLSPKGLKRLFEEERFLFPESYGVDRVRLLVKDPHWLFAYWDVAAGSLERVQKELGERAFALSRLTLRVSDPGNGGTSVILLPHGARSWYVRVDNTRRSYRAEVGYTLPSGEFRRLAESNTVVTPRVGPSPDRATRRVLYREARGLSREATLAAMSPPPAAGPFVPPHGADFVDGAGSAPAPGGPGGASDVFRR